MTPEPYFSTRDPGSDRPRLMLVSYHFAPRATAGALRWRKMAPYLHEAGWDLDVVTTPPAGPAEGGGLEELPPGVELYPVGERPGRLREFEDGLAEWIRNRGRKKGGEAMAIPGGESSQTQRMTRAEDLSWIPGSFRDFIRVYHVLLHYEELLTWAGAAQRVGDQLADRTRYGCVFASAPPWATLVAAHRLAERHSIPLVLDYRDPWSLPVPYLVESAAHPLVYTLARRYEAPAVRRSSAVIMNTPPAERAMRERYPDAHVCTILNGVDEVFQADAPGPDKQFRAIYAGTVYIDRDPRVLFRAVREVVDRLNLDPGDFLLEFIGEAGTFAGVSTEQLAAEAGITDYFRLTPQMPRAELVQELEKAAVLVSLPQSTPWSTPSKIYEYMGFGGQMMIYAEQGSSTADVLDGSGVTVLAPTDQQGTEEALERFYRDHRAGTAPGRLPGLDRFDRSQRGVELQRLLAEVGILAE